MDPEYRLTTDPMKPQPAYSLMVLGSHLALLISGTDITALVLNVYFISQAKPIEPFESFDTRVFVQPNTLSFWK